MPPPGAVRLLGPSLGPPQSAVSRNAAQSPVQPTPAVCRTRSLFPPFAHPGNRGRALHCRTAEDQIIYIASGEGAYVTDVCASRAVRAGDCIYVPAGVPNATVNTGVDGLRAIIVCTPPGPEKELDRISGFQGTSSGA